MDDKTEARITAMSPHDRELAQDKIVQMYLARHAPKTGGERKGDLTSLAERPFILAKRRKELKSIRIAAE